MFAIRRPWHIWIVSVILMVMSASYLIPTAVLLFKTMMIIDQTDLSFGQVFSPFFTVVLASLSFLAGAMLLMMRKISLYLYLSAVVMNLGWLVFMQYFSATAGAYSIGNYIKDLIPAAIISIYIFTLIKRGYLR